jgi:CRP-like cAMP-binding protein
MQIHTLETIIADHPMFAGLDSSFIDLAVGCASNIRIEPQAYITREGEESNQLFLIREGRVALEIHAPARKALVIETLGPGDIIGWSWLVPPHFWRFDARAINSTRLIALDAKCLRTKCEANHELGYEILKRFAPIIERRLEATRLQLLDVYAAH